MIFEIAITDTVNKFVVPNLKKAWDAAAGAWDATFGFVAGILQVDDVDRGDGVNTDD